MPAKKRAPTLEELIAARDRAERASLEIQAAEKERSSRRAAERKEERRRRAAEKEKDKKEKEIVKKKGNKGWADGSNTGGKYEK